MRASEQSYAQMSRAHVITARAHARACACSGAGARTHRAWGRRCAQCACAGARGCLAPGDEHVREARKAHE